MIPSSAARLIEVYRMGNSQDEGCPSTMRERSQLAVLPHFGSCGLRLCVRRKLLFLTCFLAAASMKSPT
jgi:hypothetical protein